MEKTKIAVEVKDGKNAGWITLHALTPSGRRCEVGCFKTENVDESVAAIAAVESVEITGTTDADTERNYWDAFKSEHPNTESGPYIYIVNVQRSEYDERESFAWAAYTTREAAQEVIDALNAEEAILLNAYKASGAEFGFEMCEFSVDRVPIAS